MKVQALVLLLLMAPTLAHAGDVDAGTASTGTAATGTAVTPPPIEPRDDLDGGSAPEDGGVDAGEAAGHALRVQARIDPDPVAFGARFDLVVVVKRPRGLTLSLPDDLAGEDSAPRHGDVQRTVRELPREQARAPGDAADAGTAASAGTSDDVEETLRVPFLALDLDSVGTPAFTLRGEGGATVEVPSLRVRVLPGSTALPDAGPDALPMPDAGSDAAPTVVLEDATAHITWRVADERPWLLLALLALSGVLTFIVRRAIASLRMRVVVPPAPPPPPRPAHDVALERLDALLHEGLLQRGEVDRFVERLMDEVLRDYLTARFSLAAETRTTRELVSELLSVAVIGLDVKLVEALLHDADLVKFARASLAGEHAHAMAGRVRSLIEATALRTASTSSPTSGTST